MNENPSSGNSKLEKIDVVSLFNDFFHRLRRLWWIVLVLMAASAALNYFRVSTSYSPTYVAEATVSVEIINGSSSANRNTAEQLGLVFPYILTSGALSDVIAADLGMESVPGSISVSAIKGTNLLTIDVRSWDPNYAYDTLQSVLRNYPEVAQFVVGQTALTVIDDSGVPVDTGRTAVLRGSVTHGALVGFVLGLLVVLGYAVTYRTIRTETELRELINVQCLGTLPFCVEKKRRKGSEREINILYDANRGEYVEAMRLIRTRLERQLDNKTVVMVTSSISGEGKSTVAANLAVSMALKGKSVILVDCDLRNPSIGKIFSLPGGFPGLLGVLQGRASLDEALYEVPDRNGKPMGLTVMPGSDKSSNLVEILGSETMRQAIEGLRERADVVILDAPPSGLLVDAMMLVQHVDTVAYVIMSDFARRRYILNGVEELNNAGVPIAGCILNGGKVRSGGYGYYGYKYGSKYGYGGYGTASEETSEPKKSARRERKSK